MVAEAIGWVCAAHVNAIRLWIELGAAELPLRAIDGVHAARGASLAGACHCTFRIVRARCWDEATWSHRIALNGLDAEKWLRGIASTELIARCRRKRREWASIATNNTAAIAAIYAGIDPRIRSVIASAVGERWNRNSGVDDLLTAIAQDAGLTAITTALIALHVRADALPIRRAGAV
jgi:hypothetical protein